MGDFYEADPPASQEKGGEESSDKVIEEMRGRIYEEMP
jgi:hypothetical protein